MTVWLYAGFLLFVFIMLALDLGVFNRKAHVIGTVEALAWTSFWVSLSLVFSAIVYYIYEYDWLGVASSSGLGLRGRQAALQYITGYLIEESLSVDNMVVIALVFAHFSIPTRYQHRVLFWGILGALIMRGMMIAAGTALIARFEWILYVFGALLIYTAAKIALVGDEKPDPEKNPLVRLARRVFNVTTESHGTRFIVKRGGKYHVTLLFIVLLVVESSDVIFAVDSIPAVIAVTRDPFLVFTSNIFAILGLRSLYFALAGLLDQFRYLKPSLVVLLAFVGVKLIIEHWYAIPTSVSLLVVLGILSVGIVASLVEMRRNPALIRQVEDMARAAEDAVAMTFHQAKRIAVLFIGSTVLVVGVALLLLPGPAFVVIPAGLAILATEFVWARRILKRLKTEAQHIMSFVVEGEDEKDKTK
jgi:tellurite resistance protein TerC